jgi:hypothetical protein
MHHFSCTVPTNLLQSNLIKVQGVDVIFALQQFAVTEFRNWEIGRSQVFLLLFDQIHVEESCWPNWNFYWCSG